MAGHENSRIQARRRRRARQRARLLGLSAVLVVIGLAGYGAALVGGSPARAASSGSAHPSATSGHTATSPSTTVTPTTGTPTTVASTTTTVPAPTTTQRPTTPPTTAPVDKGGSIHPLPIGQMTVTLVDTSRTVDHPPTVGPRTLVTWVLYPARLGSAAAPPVTDAHPATGVYPLVEFAHGFDRSPEQYASLLEAWARAGYVVAAPAFPLTNAALANQPGGLANLDEGDVANQPADMAFVMDQLLQRSAAPGHLISGVIDPNRLAVAGHSDGANTALAVAADSVVPAPHLDAAIVMSGEELGLPGGSYFTAGSPPLLVTQGSADSVNPPGNSQAIYQQSPPPKYLLTLVNGTHDGPYEAAGPAAEVVQRATVAFLDAYLAGHSPAVARIVTEGTVPGVAAMTAQP